VADRSLGSQLTLLAKIFILTGLLLGWDAPDIRTPGRGEEGGNTGMYCPHCGFELSRRPDEGNALFCDDDGAIGEDEALGPSPPARS
jgi:hypothetical protein